MDLKKYKFPKITDADIAFSTVKTDKMLLEEAQKRGFDKDNNPYNKLFSTLFFEGGQLKFKKGLAPEFLDNGVRYLKAFMRSWEPKHEHKAAVSALLLSELAEL